MNMTEDALNNPDRAVVSAPVREHSFPIGWDPISTKTGETGCPFLDGGAMKEVEENERTE